MKSARIEQKKTMKAVADDVGISESYYCMIEKGARKEKLDADLVKKLSSSLKIPTAEIIELECAD